MLWHFLSYLGMWSTEKDQIDTGATSHVAKPQKPALSISCQLMPWRLQEPRHQQAWYWPNKPEYSVTSIRRVKTVSMMLDKTVLAFDEITERLRRWRWSWWWWWHMMVMMTTHHHHHQFSDRKNYQSRNLEVKWVVSPLWNLYPILEKLSPRLIFLSWWWSWSSSSSSWSSSWSWSSWW